MIKPDRKTPLIINFTPTGMIPTKEITKWVPISPAEIIEDVHRAYEIGITIVHLHARDAGTGVPTHQKVVYQTIIEGIREYCPDLVICVSTSGRNVNDFNKRSEVLELEPDMASLTLSSLNFMRQASVNEPGMILGLIAKMFKYGVTPELEAFDVGMINFAKDHIKRGTLVGPLYFNLIVGNIASAQADLLHIASMVNSLPDNALWSLGGIGKAQLTANMTGVAFGGGVRVGLEDNIYSAYGNRISNGHLVSEVHRMAQIMGRSIMKPKDFGELGFYNHKRK